MAQQKSLTDSFENLTSAVAQATKPIADEAGKVLETAKAQIASDQGTGEQGQAAASAAQISAMKQQEDAAKDAKMKSLQARLHQMVQETPKKQEKTVIEKKEEEKKVEQFKLAEKKKKELKPIAVQRGKTAAEANRGASG